MAIVIDEAYLLTWTPFFPWINDSEHKFIEIFPGNWIVLSPPVEDSILESRTPSKTNFYLMKACASLSEKTSHGLVSEFWSSEDIMDEFLQRNNSAIDYDEGLGLMILTGTSILFGGDHLMRRLVCTEGVSYSKSLENIEKVELKSIFFDNFSDLTTRIIERDEFQDLLKWIWELTFILVHEEEDSRLIRFLSYCSSAQYHNNEYHKLMNYYSALESLFNFHGSISKKIADIIPLISFFSDEEYEGIEFDEFSKIVQMTMKNVSILRNVYAHGNTMKTKHLEMIADVTSDLETILNRVLMGIIYCGFLPKKNEMKRILEEGSRFVDLLKQGGFHKKHRVFWDSNGIPNEMKIDSAQSRFEDQWLVK